MKKNQKIIGSVVLLIVIGVFCIIGYKISKSSNVDTKDVFIDTSSNSSTESKNEKSNVKDNEKSKTDITVEIRGEVKKPGIYTLSKGSRVHDLIDIAGGFTETADCDSIIQVTPLSDNMYVKVNKKGVASSASSQGTSADGKININTATKEQLMTISGIGETTAQKIIDYREKNGMFKSIEDLKKVGRIGDKTISKWKDKITVY